jgi:hypothetical protein
VNRRLKRDSEPPRIGIIAEDASDVKVIVELVRKICPKNYGVSQFVGEGCGRIVGKCRTWSEQLKERGCKYLLIIHDSDRRDVKCLEKMLADGLNASPIDNYAIVIPVREIEAWLLSDENAITTAMHLRKKLGKVVSPEKVLDPKKKLGEIIYVYSEKKIIYVNTIHNQRIANACSIETLRRCESFDAFYKFVDSVPK